jgi:hypothetical protein
MRWVGHVGCVEETTNCKYVDMLLVNLERKSNGGGGGDRSVLIWNSDIVLNLKRNRISVYVVTS